jgi:hypothetical protein
MLSEIITKRFPLVRTLAEQAIGVRGTGYMSLAAGQAEARHQERCRSGRIFRGVGGTTGVAPVTAVPTTAAAWVLWNSGWDRSLVIDTIDFFLLSGTPVIGGTILAIVSPITATLPAAATGSAIGSNSYGERLSRAVFGTGYTLPTPVNQYRWGIVSSRSQPGGVAGVGGCWSADVNGSIIVPPRMVLGLTMLAGAGSSPLYIPGVTWTEAELDLE